MVDTHVPIFSFKKHFCDLELSKKELKKLQQNFKKTKHHITEGSVP